MTEKFLIELNKEKLSKKIDDFTSKNGYIPYIFVNRDTLKILKEPIEPVMVFFYGGLVEEYLGCKIFEDNTLKFGEVELR